MKRNDKVAPTPATQNLVGLILCGGRSRRMGSDKGLLLKEGIPWASWMAAKLAPWHIPVYYSLNAGQIPAYSSVISNDDMVIDGLGLEGPLEGLLSAHKRLPASDLLLLACDMLNMDHATLETLLDAYAQDGGGEYDFFAFGAMADPAGVRETGTKRHFAEPLCGIYRARGLAREYAAISGAPAKNLNRDHSMHALLKRGRTRFLPITNEGAFRNYNFPAE